MRSSLATDHSASGLNWFRPLTLELDTLLSVFAIVFDNVYATQQGQTTARALLEADLECVIFVCARGVERVVDNAELRVRNQCPDEGSIPPVVHVVLVWCIESVELPETEIFQNSLPGVARPTFRQHTLRFLKQTVRAQRRRNFRIELASSDQGSRQVQVMAVNVRHRREHVPRQFPLHSNREQLVVGLVDVPVNLIGIKDEGVWPEGGFGR